MPVPSTIADLSSTASANSPAGTEPVGTSMDDYIRAVSAIVRQVSDAKADTSHTQTVSTISDATTAGKALLTAADVAAQRTALGLGTAATQASSAFSASGAVTANGNTMATSKLLGRTTAGSGAIEEISLGSGISMTSGVISAAGGISITSLETANTLDTSPIHTIAHGKGSIPVILCFRLVVTSAVSGWSVGDVIDKWIAITGTSEEHISVGADNTNIIVARGATTIGIANKSTGANSGASLSNFKLKVFIVS